MLYQQKKPFCGGSIISSQHILTAAHCTFDKVPSSIQVLVGEHDTTDDNDMMYRIDIYNIINHPKFDNENGNYDFSILLVFPITFSPLAAPICLPSSMHKLYTNWLATVIGWGMTSEGSSSPKLQKVEVKIISNEKCKDIYGEKIERWALILIFTITFMTCIDYVHHF